MADGLGGFLGNSIVYLYTLNKAQLTDNEKLELEKLKESLQRA